MLVELLLVTGPMMATTDLKEQLQYAESLEHEWAQRAHELKIEIACLEMASMRDQILEARRDLVEPPTELLGILAQKREMLQHIIVTLPECRREAEQLHQELLGFITDLDNANLLPPSPYATILRSYSLKR